MKMAKIVLPKWSGKRSKVREKSLKSQGILKRILSGNPDGGCKKDWVRKVEQASLARVTLS